MGAARLRGSWPASDYTEADHEHALGGMHALLREGEGLIGHGAVVMRRPVHNGQCAAHRLCRGRRGPRRPAPPRGTATSSWRRWSASSAGATCWAPSARADEEGGTYVPPGQRTAGCRRRSRLRLARRRTVVTSASSVQPRHGQRPTRRHAFAPGSRRANGRWRARLAIRILCHMASLIDTSHGPMCGGRPGELAGHTVRPGQPPARLDLRAGDGRVEDGPPKTLDPPPGHSTGLTRSGRSRYASRSVNFWIFPEGVRGNSSTNTT